MSDAMRALRGILEAHQCDHEAACEGGSECACEAELAALAAVEAEMARLDTALDDACKLVVTMDRRLAAAERERDAAREQVHELLDRVGFLEDRYGHESDQ